MNKVAYLSPYNDATGYAIASIRTMLALDRAGVDILPREVKLASQTVMAPDRIQELAKATALGCDTIIQHILPPSFIYNGNFKNIGYFHTETTTFRPSGWQYYLNLMDEIWVSSHENRLAAENSGVNVPIKVVPIPADFSVYEQEHGKLGFDTGNRFVFYNIADFSSRKNIMGLVEAYLTEFSSYDNVILVLKTYIESHSSPQSKQKITDAINELKNSLRKGNADSYAKIVLITNYLSQEKIYQIHKLGDCFVSTERAAAWNIPAFDAMAFGNYTIVNGWGGQTQFCHGDSNVARTEFRMSNVQGMIHCPYKTIYTAHEQWADPDVLDIQDKMRVFYEKGRMTPENKFALSQARLSGQLSKYSLDEAGKTIAGLL